MSAGVCRVCDWAPATRRGRCDTCDRYYRRHGFERPEKLIVAHGQRVLDKLVLARSAWDNLP